MGVKTSWSYFIAICFKTFWWWWTLRALVMIHRSEASKVWMQKPESSQMRFILRAILHLVWTWYQYFQIYLRGARDLSQHDDEMNIALLDHRPEVVHCVRHGTLGSSFSEDHGVTSQLGETVGHRQTAGKSRHIVTTTDNFLSCHDISNVLVLHMR